MMFGIKRKKDTAVMEPVPDDHRHSFGPWSRITEGRWSGDFYQVRYCVNKQCNQQDSRKVDWDHDGEDGHVCRMAAWSKPWWNRWRDNFQSRGCIDCGMADVRKCH